MTAAPDASFLITAQVREASTAFNVLAYEDTKKIGIEQYKTLITKHLGHAADVIVQHASTDTPTKRLYALTSLAAASSTPQDMSKRRKFE